MQSAKMNLLQFHFRQFIIAYALSIALASGFLTASAQSHPEAVKNNKMDWFQDAKLGIFIHWGIYAVNGIDESWSFYNEYLSHDGYLKQVDGFTADQYQPAYWAKLIKDSGAKYAVITAKHHDGFALWDSKYGSLNVMNSPARRDLIGPFVESLRSQSLKVGLYYSLPDWSYPDYPNATRTKKRYQDDSVRWKRFTTYNHNQLKELSSRYRPDLFWFDGDWEFSAESWKSKEMSDFLRADNPAVIVNSRLSGYGDYATPEQGVPIVKPQTKYWELCMTMNDSWGYQGNDTNYKTTNQIIRIFVDCLSMGGNLLLDIGPKANGTIPAEQVRILEELGRWTSKHGEAIYGTRSGLPSGHYYGPSTLSANGETLYLFITQIPRYPIVLKGLKNQINRIRIVGEGTKLTHQIVGKMYWSEVPGLIYIDIPKEKLDKQVTVIAIQLKGKIALYREDGAPIESN
jgi:alpha-L-fucosidase